MLKKRKKAGAHNTGLLGKAAKILLSSVFIINIVHQCLITVNTVNKLLTKPLFPPGLVALFLAQFQSDQATKKNPDRRRLGFRKLGKGHKSNVDRIIQQNGRQGKNRSSSV